MSVADYTVFGEIVTGSKILGRHCGLAGPAPRPVWEHTEAPMRLSTETQNKLGPAQEAP